VKFRDGTVVPASLARLGTDHLDLYLLRWRNGITDLSSVVTAFERLRSQGKIRAWGVSNFTVSDMEDLFRVRNGDHCNPDPGIEHHLTCSKKIVDKRCAIRQRTQFDR
jgi:diketogulonate reductase-like aldo/keto reductase